MSISVFSVLMSILWSSLVIFLLYYGFKKRVLIRKFGMVSVLMMYLLCAIRLLIPIELPFVKIITLEKTFSKVYDFLFLQDFYIGKFSFQVSYILAGIWLAVSVIIFLYRVVEYNRGIYIILQNRIVVDLTYKKILSEIKEEKKRNLSVMVWKTNQIDIPMGIGLLHKRIILPDRMYTEADLKNILLHEYTHFINHDTWIKFYMNIFSVLFWWNPMVYLLEKELDKILEIRCDLAVVDKMNKREKIQYLDTILKSIKNNSRQVKMSSMVQLVYTKNQPEIVERFRIVRDEEKGKVTKKTSWYVIGIMFLLFIGSYVFQFQSAYEPPSLSPEEIISPENAYIIDCGNDIYKFIDKLGRSKEPIILEKEHVENLIEQGFELKQQ